MLRFLFFLLIAYLFLSALRAYFFGRSSRRPGQRRAKGREPEEMVLDPQCGSYVPRGEAFVQDGQFFCSQECARLFLSR